MYSAVHRQLGFTLLLLVTLGCAQGPFDGLSKTTLAAETDPLGAMAFLQRHFGATADSDSCNANICNCPSGSSDAKRPWEAVLGRCDLVKEGFPAGQCTLYAVSSGSMASRNISTSIMRGATPGGDCSYRNSEKIQGDALYTVKAHTPDTCCKACTAVPWCIAATFMDIGAASLRNDKSNFQRYSVQGLGLEGPPKYEGFGLHLPAVRAHKNTGGLSVSEVEEIVASKMGEMGRFDSWMDFSAALFTANLDLYLRVFAADGVPYLGATWTAADGSGMYSVFVHVPRSQMVIELIGQSSAILRARPSSLVRLEQRLSAQRTQSLSSTPPGILRPVRVSRAASNLDAVDRFYRAMRTNVTLTINTAGVGVRCYVWAGTAVDVCFVKRPDNATTGVLKVADFELMLQTVTNTVVTRPSCNMNRWADNHYAVDVFDGDFDYIVDYIEAHPEIKYQCATAGVPGLHYVYDPTGWAVQLNMIFNRQPNGCMIKIRADNGSSSPMCSGGTCE